MELYIAENNRILTTLVAPAYIALADAVFSSLRKRHTRGGLCELPSGGAYYLYLLRHNTGTSRTPEEIQVLLSDRFQLCYQNLQALVETYREQTGNTSISLQDIPAFPFRMPRKSLQIYSSGFKQIFLRLIHLPKLCRTCRTKAVAESMEEFTSPAFYLTPPIDDMGRQCNLCK